MAFDIQVYSKENELIFEKDSSYAMPGLVENVQRHEEWTNFVLNDGVKEAYLQESITYYPNLLGNYTVSIEGAQFDATFINVNGNVIVDFVSAKKVFPLTCEIQGDKHEWNEDDFDHSDWRRRRLQIGETEAAIATLKTKHEAEIANLYQSLEVIKEVMDISTDEYKTYIKDEIDGAKYYQDSQLTEIDAYTAELLTKWTTTDDAEESERI